MGILTNTIEDSYEAWAWARLPRSQRLVYELEMADDAVNRLIDPDYAAAQQRIADRRGWTWAHRSAVRVRDYLVSRVARLVSTAAAKPVMRTQRQARRSGRSARKPAAGGDDSDGDGDPEPPPASPLHVPLSPQIDFERALAAEGMPADILLSTEDDGQAHEHVIKTRDRDLDFDRPGAAEDVSLEFGHERPGLINGGWLDVDPVTQIQHFYASVEDELIAAEEAGGISDEDRLRAQLAADEARAAHQHRLLDAVMTTCRTPRQYAAVAALRLGATEKEAAAVAGYSRVTCLTKHLSRLRARAKAGDIKLGWKAEVQLDLFCDVDEGVRS